MSCFDCQCPCRTRTGVELSDEETWYTSHGGTDGFRQVAPLPESRTPILIDGVVDTGTSTRAAFHALGNRGVVLSFAMSDALLEQEQERHVGFHR